MLPPVCTQCTKFIAPAFRDQGAAILALDQFPILQIDQFHAKDLPKQRVMVYMDRRRGTHTFADITANAVARVQFQ